MRKDTLVVRLLMCAVIAGAALGCREHRMPPTGGGGTGGPDTMRTGGSGGGGGLRDGSTTGGTGGGAAGGSGGSGGTPATDAPASDGTSDVEEPDMVVPDVPITCDPACAMGEVCVNGQCVSPCLPTQTNCPSGCSELPTDPANCGMCGRACPAGQFCSGGNCVMACMNGETRCDQSCVNLDNNVKNCGICGKSCAGAEACVSRVCQCVTPNVVCGGACTNVRNNRDHCGRCNNRCGGDLVCNGTSCGCPGGRRVCPNNPNKCVTSLNECCPSGQSWCTNAGNGGGCVDLRSDRNHCNSCTTVCPGQDVCTDRRCICPSTLKDCGGGVCICHGHLLPGQGAGLRRQVHPLCGLLQRHGVHGRGPEVQPGHQQVRVCSGRTGLHAHRCARQVHQDDGHLLQRTADCGGRRDGLRRDDQHLRLPGEPPAGLRQHLHRGRRVLRAAGEVPADRQVRGPHANCPRAAEPAPWLVRSARAEGRCACPTGQMVCGTKCIPREGCCGTCSGNRVCNDQNMCICPQDRTCGDSLLPRGPDVPDGTHGGGMRCGVRPNPEPGLPPGGQPSSSQSSRRLFARCASPG